MVSLLKGSGIRSKYNMDTACSLLLMCKKLSSLFADVKNHIILKLPVKQFLFCVLLS